MSKKKYEEQPTDKVGAETVTEKTGAGTGVEEGTDSTEKGVTLSGDGEVTSYVFSKWRKNF